MLCPHCHSARFAADEDDRLTCQACGWQETLPAPPLQDFEYKREDARTALVTVYRENETEWFPTPYREAWQFECIYRVTLRGIVVVQGARCLRELPKGKKGLNVRYLAELIAMELGRQLKAEARVPVTSITG